MIRIRASIADRSVTRAKLEYPTENIPLLYLFFIGKAFQDLTDANANTFMGTVDNFTDKMIGNAQLMKVAEARYYEGLLARAQADPRTHTYITRVDTGQALADGRLERIVGGVITSIGNEAVNLVDDTAYIHGISSIGSSIKRVRFNRWTVTGTPPNISFGTATVRVTATDTNYSSGRFLEKHSQLGGPDYPAGLTAWLLPPASPAPPALAVLEVEVEGGGTQEDPYRPLLSKNLVEIRKLEGLPEQLYKEAKKHEMLKSKGFTEEEMMFLLGYIPRYQVDLASVTWGGFEFNEKSPTNIIIIAKDESRTIRAKHIQRHKELAKSKNLKVLKPPKSYKEAVAQYKQLMRDYQYWQAGKDNYAYQVLGLEELELFQNVDFYYGELIEHKTHYDQLKRVPEWELWRRLEELERRLSKITVLTGERDSHLKKLKTVKRLGW